MTSEALIQRAIRLHVSKLGARLFRHNVATSWVGEVSHLKDGSVLIRNPRIMHAGLVRGGSDLIGWTPVTITPEMVGHVVSVFTAIECKRPRGGRKSPEQVAFVNAILRDGGFAGFARSEDEAAAIITRP